MDDTRVAHATGTRTTPRATIVAFDGLVVDTLPARALAVSDAVTAEVAPCSLAAASTFVQGQSLDEAVEAALRAFLTPSQLDLDATLRDLAVLRARRSFTAMVSQGLPLCDGAAAWLAARAATHGRVVLRAESSRRDVDRLLAFTGLGDVVAFIRCSDDLPRAMGQSAARNGWLAIESRLATQRVALREATAFEVTDASAAVARTYLDDVQQVGALVEVK